MAELINASDSLNDGRKKLNDSIEQADRAETKSVQAVTTSNEAKSIANSAEDKADNVQSQFDQVVIEGDSSVEAAQARVDAMGGVHTTLKKRVDRQEFVVSKAAPPNTSFWFEDRGDSGLQVSTGSGISVQNAIVSDDEIDDKTKLWFDK